MNHHWFIINEFCVIQPKVNEWFCVNGIKQIVPTTKPMSLVIVLST